MSLDGHYRVCLWLWSPFISEPTSLTSLRLFFRIFAFGQLGELGFDAELTSVLSCLRPCLTLSPLLCPWGWPEWVTAAGFPCPPPPVCASAEEGHHWPIREGEWGPVSWSLPGGSQRWLLRLWLWGLGAARLITHSALGILQQGDWWRRVRPWELERDQVGTRLGNVYFCISPNFSNNELSTERWRKQPHLQLHQKEQDTYEYTWPRR